MMSGPEEVCFDACNQYRLLEGLPALIPDAGLAAAAGEHAKLCNQCGGSHTPWRKDGNTCNHILTEEFLQQFGWEGWQPNLYTRGYKDPEAVAYGWYLSPNHHFWLCHPGYNYGGVGRAGAFYVLFLGAK